MKELKQIYQRTSKQTQNRLQEIFDSLDFDSSNLYNIANTKTKNRVNTYIEEWKDKGILTGYFGMLANNIYKRTRVKNSEILELLIYSAYIEEQSKIEETELNIMKEDATYYYNQGINEVRKAKGKKEMFSIIPDAIFLALLDMPNSKGYVWKQYTEAITKYNADQIYRQATIDLQQQKKLDITNDIYQNIIKRQQNSRLNINGDKISGDIDLTLIGINNKAKIEGIDSFDNKAEVEFISVEDEKTTPMCKSLNSQRFKIHGWNEFERHSASNGRIMKYRCYGLVVGLNCPPIDDHFHWCRSYILYVPPVEKDDKTEYNLDIPKISKEVKRILGKTELNNKVKKLFNKYLTAENTEIDKDLEVPMRYSVDKDKILINPEHPEFKYYDLGESLSHEIIHMIDIRNNISDKLNVDNELRRTRLSIDIGENKYIDMLNSAKYEDNMTLGDIFSAVTNGKITGNFGHKKEYWLEDITRVEKELSSNIMSAYLTNNKDTLDILNSIESLKEIKEKVVKKYGIHTD